MTIGVVSAKPYFNAAARQSTTVLICTPPTSLHVVVDFTYHGPLIEVEHCPVRPRIAVDVSNLKKRKKEFKKRFS